MSNTDDRLDEILDKELFKPSKHIEAVPKEYISKQEVAEAIDSCYQYEITDLELAEHRGEELIVISAAELRKKLNLTIKESKS